MTFISSRRIVAAFVAAACLAVPSAAVADTLPSTYRSDAAQSGSPPSNGRTDAAQSGQDATSPRATLVAQHLGDNPADHPGMPGVPDYDSPTTIEVR